jgi:hypothetical protein
MDNDFSDKIPIAKMLAKRQSFGGNLNVGFS